MRPRAVIHHHGSNLSIIIELRALLAKSHLGANDLARANELLTELSLRLPEPQEPSRLPDLGDKGPLIR